MTTATANAPVAAAAIGSVNEEVLRTLDFIAGVDISGSTSKPSHRAKGKSRLGEMQEEAGRIIRAAGKYDSDGLTLVTFSSVVNVIDGVTAERIESTFGELESAGGTDLGGCIRAFTAKAVQSSKPVVGFIWTDGEASNPNDVLDAVREAADATKGRPKLGIVIVQTGNDQSARDYLDHLDNGLKAQGIPDMIAVVTEDKSEGLSFGQLVWLAQNA